MESHSDFVDKRQKAFDLVRFTGGFLDKHLGRTKITRSDANNIIHIFAEALKISYIDLVYDLVKLNPKYEGMFRVEQYNRNNLPGKPNKIEFDWPQGA